MSYASECYNQICALDSMAVFDWGAIRQGQQPVALNNGKTLCLKSAGMVKWKGYIAITYNEGTDLYDIEFYRIRRQRRTASNPIPVPEKKVDYSVTDIFVDQLIETIDRQVLGR